MTNESQVRYSIDVIMYQNSYKIVGRLTYADEPAQIDFYFSNKPRPLLAILPSSCRASTTLSNTPLIKVLLLGVL